MVFVLLQAQIFSLRASDPPARKCNRVRHPAMETTCLSVVTVPLQKMATGFLKVVVRKTGLILLQNWAALIFTKVPGMTWFFWKRIWRTRIGFIVSMISPTKDPSLIMDSNFCQNHSILYNLMKSPDYVLVEDSSRILSFFFMEGWEIECDISMSWVFDCYEHKFIAKVKMVLLWEMGAMQKVLAWHCCTSYFVITSPFEGRQKFYVLIYFHF